MYTDCYVFFVLNAYQSCKKCILVCNFYAIFYFFCVEYIPNEIISIWYVFFYDLVGNFLIVYIPKLKKISLVCICFWFTGWILLKIHTIFLIKQIGMHKEDLSRELYPNFTYQIEKNAFWYVYTGLPRPKGLAMTCMYWIASLRSQWRVELIATIFLWKSRNESYSLCTCGNVEWFEEFCVRLWNPAEGVHLGSDGWKSTKCSGGAFWASLRAAVLRRHA